MSEFEKINGDLYRTLFKNHKKMLDRVLDYKMCDIGPEFLGFVKIYYHLSKIIPKHWIVVDLGCAYAPQAYYFRNHKKYIGIDLGNCEKFKFKNTEFHTKTIVEELKDWKYTNKKEVFAICNAVPTDTTALRETFPNLFVSYPSPKI